MATKRSKKNGIGSASSSDRDEIRMKKSGAAASGYHAPSSQDIEDIRKDHSTASEPGVINADEGVRRDAEDAAGPIDSLSGKILDPLGDEEEEIASA